MSEMPESFHQNPGMRLNLELGTLLGLRIESLDQVFRATLVGQIPQEYLIIKTSIPKEFESGIIPGIKFHISYQSMETEYGFSATLLDMIEKPCPLTFLSYPEKVAIRETRNLSRVCCYIPSSIQMNDTIIKGTITDISVNGCRFVVRLPNNLMPRQVLLLDAVILTFPILGIKGIQAFSGIVRNTTIDREKIALGVEFLNVDPKLLSSIEDYICNVTEISLNDGNAG